MKKKKKSNLSISTSYSLDMQDERQNVFQPKKSF